MRSYLIIKELRNGLILIKNEGACKFQRYLSFLEKFWKKYYVGFVAGDSIARNSKYRDSSKETSPNIIR